MKKTLLIWVLFASPAFALPSEAEDRVACEHVRFELIEEIKADHVLKIKEETTAILQRAYKDTGVSVAQDQIQYEEPFFVYGDQKVEFEMTAYVDAGENSITSTSMFYLKYANDHERRTETDSLGRIVKTELVCNAYAYSGVIYVVNAETQVEIGVAPISYVYKIYSVILP